MEINCLVRQICTRTVEFSVSVLHHPECVVFNNNIKHALAILRINTCHIKSMNQTSISSEVTRHRNSRTRQERSCCLCPVTGHMRSQQRSWEEQKESPRTGSPAASWKHCCAAKQQSSVSVYRSYVVRQNHPNLWRLGPHKSGKMAPSTR